VFSMSFSYLLIVFLHCFLLVYFVTLLVYCYTVLLRDMLFSIFL